MSYCLREGKDRVVIMTKEDYIKPSTAVLLEDDGEDDEPGLINPDGSINWNCPCLGGIASGPCSVQFRDAFGCFYHSKEDEENNKPKGAECVDKFERLQECMEKYPGLYFDDEEEETSEIEEALKEAAELEAEEKINAKLAETSISDKSLNQKDQKLSTESKKSTSQNLSASSKSELKNS